MTPLERITERVTRLGHPDNAETPRPLVTVDEFFDGNTEVGSIGCNLESTPTPAQFYEVFRAIGQRPEVKDIRFYILTSASPDEVASWFPKELTPDETWEGFVDQPYEPYQIPEGTRPIACWWD